MARKLSKFIKTAPSDRAANWISHTIRLCASTRRFKTSVRRYSEFFMDAQILSNLVNERWKWLLFIDLLMIEMICEMYHSHLLFDFLLYFQLYRQRAFHDFSEFSINFYSFHETYKISFFSRKNACFNKIFLQRREHRNKSCCYGSRNRNSPWKMTRTPAFWSAIKVELILAFCVTLAQNSRICPLMMSLSAVSR